MSELIQRKGKGAKGSPPKKGQKEVTATLTEELEQQLTNQEVSPAKPSSSPSGDESSWEEVIPTPPSEKEEEATTAATTETAVAVSADVVTTLRASPAPSKKVASPPTASSPSPPSSSPSSSSCWRTFIQFLSYLAIFLLGFGAGQIYRDVPSWDQIEHEYYRLRSEYSSYLPLITLYEHGFNDYYQLTGYTPPQWSRESGRTGHVRGAFDHHAFGITDQDCLSLSHLLDGGRNFREHANTKFDFEGLNLNVIDGWISHEQSHGNQTAVDELKRMRSLVLYIRENAVRTVRTYFNDPHIQLDYTSLHKRTPRSEDKAHGLHADNCAVNFHNYTCNKATHCCPNREYSAVFYFSGADGGDFLFHNVDPAIQPRDVPIPPTCGRLVFFSSGFENVHGVNKILSGARYSMAMWFTYDESKSEKPDVPQVPHHWWLQYLPSSITHALGLDANVTPKPIISSTFTPIIPNPPQTHRAGKVNSQLLSDISQLNPAQYEELRQQRIAEEQRQQAGQPLQQHILPSGATVTVVPLVHTSGRPAPILPSSVRDRYRMEFERLTGTSPPPNAKRPGLFIRGAVDRNAFDVSPEQCQALMGLLDGGHTHTERPGTEQRYEALSLGQLDYWKTSEYRVGNATLAAELEQKQALLLKIRTETVNLLREYFAEDELYIDFTHLTKRFNLSDEYSHGPHADNCLLNWENRTCTELPNNCCAWHRYSALLYFNEVEGGEFVFHDDPFSSRPKRVTLSPTCGRLVFFSSGVENLHAVAQVTKGTRYAVAMWLTTDRAHAEEPIVPLDPIPALESLSPKPAYILESESLTTGAEIIQTHAQYPHQQQLQEQQAQQEHQHHHVIDYGLRPGDLDEFGQPKPRVRKPHVYGKVEPSQLREHVRAQFERITGETPPMSEDRPGLYVRGALDAHAFDVTNDDCQAMMHLLEGGHTRMEKAKYEGLNLMQLQHWISEEFRIGNATYAAELRKTQQLVLKIRTESLKLMKQYFAEDELYVDFTHLTKRQNRGESYSHGIHSDNCLVHWGNKTCEQRPNNCCSYRRYSALFYFNRAQGGEFLFQDDAFTDHPRNTTILPTCGRLVFFSSGVENLHGVLQVQNGARYALAMWFSHDPIYMEQPEIVLTSNELEQPLPPNPLDPEAFAQQYQQRQYQLEMKRQQKLQQAAAAAAAAAQSTQPTPTVPVDQPTQVPLTTPPTATTTTSTPVVDHVNVQRTSRGGAAASTTPLV